MSEMDGSSLQLKSAPEPAQAQLVPHVLCPVPNRHLPLPAKFASNLLGRPSLIGHSNSTSTDKAKILVSESILKRTIKEEVIKVQSMQGATELVHKEDAIKAEVIKVQSTQGVTDLAHREDVKKYLLPSVSSASTKQQKKTRRKRLLLHAPGLVDGMPDGLASNGCRYDSSLSLLTKKFVNLVQQSKDGSIDLNEAAVILEVQKRRIYDITNVLEGVGLMEKTLKNRIRWKGNDVWGPAELESYIAELKISNETLFKEETELDKMIRDMEDNVRALTEGCDQRKKFLYLTKDDINNLPCFQNSTLIAVKAPHGTSIEVPDPDEGHDFLEAERRYQMFVRSSMGPIDCFLINNHEERLKAPTLQQPKPMDLSADVGCDNRTDGLSSHQSEKIVASVLNPSQGKNMMSEENVGSIVKIVPPDHVDADYWFDLDLKSSLTDMWR